MQDVSRGTTVACENLPCKSCGESIYNKSFVAILFHVEREPTTIGFHRIKPTLRATAVPRGTFLGSYGVGDLVLVPTRMNRLSECGAGIGFCHSHCLTL